MTITASFEPETYHITYNTNGGAFDSAPTDTYTYETGVATLPTDIKKAGYTFEGWHDNAALTGNPFTAIDATETGDKTFWAKWEAKSYTVKFDSDGGSTIEDKTVYWEDALLADVTAPTKTGWEFLGWKYADTPVTAQTTYKDIVSSDSVQSILLKAEWKEVPSSAENDNRLPDPDEPNSPFFLTERAYCCRHRRPA